MPRGVAKSGPSGRPEKIKPDMAADVQSMLGIVRQARIDAQAAAASGGGHAPVMAALRLEAGLADKVATLRIAQAAAPREMTIEELVAGIVRNVDKVPESLLEQLADALGGVLGDLSPYSRTPGRE